MLDSDAVWVWSRWLHRRTNPSKTRKQCNWSRPHALMQLSSRRRLVGPPCAQVTMYYVGRYYQYINVVGIGFDLLVAATTQETYSSSKAFFGGMLPPLVNMTNGFAGINPVGCHFTIQVTALQCVFQRGTGTIAATFPWLAVPADGSSSVPWLMSQ